MHELISIIIPVYNGDKYLKRCIDSIINQTYNNLEIIVVNDGSTDNSKSILEEYAKMDKRIIVINKENGGVSSARNIGLENAMGDFIVFVDSDDYVENNMCKLLIKSIIKNNSDVAICNLFYENFNNEIVYDFNCEDFNFNKEKYPENSYYLPSICGYVCNKIYSRKLILSNNIKFNSNITIAEDDLFNYEIFNSNKDIKYSYINNKLYHYVINSNSATKRNFNLKKLTYFDAKEKEIEILNSNNINSDFLKADYIINFVRTKLIMEKLKVNKNEKYEYIKSLTRKYKKELSYKNLSFKLAIKLIIATKFKFIYKFKLRNEFN